MAVSRVKEWISGEVLTAADLNAEFDNIVNGGVSVITPLTGSIAAAGFDITGLDEVGLDNAGADASAAGRLRRNSTNLTWHDGTSAKPLVMTTATQTLTNKTLGATSMDTNAAFTPAAVSGTPAQHALYRENVVKGWIKCDYSGSISDSFNVSGITDNATGDTTVTWDRDFASAHYAATASALTTTAASLVAVLNTLAAGSCRIRTSDTGVPTDGDILTVIAIGDQ
jgi:hypothetical protein